MTQNERKEDGAWEKWWDEQWSMTALRAQLEAERATVQDLIHVIQLYQPAGSPPPGDIRILARWILDSLQERAEKAEAALAEIRFYLQTRRWLIDGRGPYQYDDPDLREEIRETFNEIYKLTWPDTRKEAGADE